MVLNAMAYFPCFVLQIFLIRNLFTMKKPIITYVMVVAYYDFTDHGHYATGRCPKCDYGNDCCTITQKKEDNGFLIYCHSCQDSQLFSYVIKEVANHANGDNPAPISIKNATNSQTTASQEQDRLRALRYWQYSEAPQNLAVDTYLTNRRVMPTKGIPESIRLHELLPDLNGIPRPAMVAKITDFNQNFLGVYRTYLAKDGRKKADIVTPKAALGAIRGGSVHLAPADDIIGLTEGIETGLAVMKLFNIPVWACLGTSGLKAIQLPPLPKVKEVLIFADNDNKNRYGKNPGLDAAFSLAARLKAEGRKVTVFYPPTAGTDFADEAYRLASNEGVDHASE